MRFIKELNMKYVRFLARTQIELTVSLTSLLSLKAIVQVKVLRWWANSKTLNSQTIDPTFRSGDKVARPDIMENEVIFLWGWWCYNFMDPNSYEQYEVGVDTLGDTVNFMTENLKVSMLFYKGAHQCWFT